ncbi:MAG: heme o synthase [Planctomycetota bacterium]|nr:heme o synthase [Planctomycetota bacterium]MDG2084564.1 heme o synthase [Planctomycetota bacterium]
MKETQDQPKHPDSSKNEDPGLISDLIQLAKPRLTLLVVITASLGVATSWSFTDASSFRGTTDQWLDRWGALLAISAGTALLAAAANSLNMLWERKQDQLMKRTAVRATARGRVGAAIVIPYSILTGSLGSFLVWQGGTVFAAILGIVSLLLYVLVYTPLKMRTTLNTLFGAIPGALPPMIGWCGAGGSPFHPVGLTLFGILFIWQIPHFLAIAWMHRAEYEKAGFRMLPSIDKDGHRTALTALLWSLLLWGVSLIPTLMQSAGLIYLGVSSLGGIYMSYRSYQLLKERSQPAARRLFFASLLYLPIVLGALVADAGPIS